MQISRMSK